MKVLVLTNLYPSEAAPFFGIFVREQVEVVRALGIDVDVQFINGMASKVNYFKGLLEFWRRIGREQYDLIHAHYVYSGWIARMQSRLPVVVTSHGSDTLGFQGRLLRRLYPLVDTLTITSRQNQERIGLPDTYLLPCGVDMELFHPMDNLEAKQKIGWDETRKIMLYVGRDAPLKRLDVIRDAHAIVCKSRDDVDLILATSVAHNDLPLYANAADVFVFASETEGSPVVIKEAMACNLPIVSVDVGDVVELISGTDQCYICERTPESMAEDVLSVLAAGSRSNGRGRIELYSTRAAAERLIGIYRDVLARHTAKARRQL